MDGAFIAIGHEPQSEHRRGPGRHRRRGLRHRPRAARRGPSRPGVFAAGDLVDHTYRQAVTAAGSGCQAALDAEWYLRDTPEVPTPEGMPEGDLAEAQWAQPSRADGAALTGSLNTRTRDLRSRVGQPPCGSAYVLVRSADVRAGRFDRRSVSAATLFVEPRPAGHTRAAPQSFDEARPSRRTKHRFGRASRARGRPCARSTTLLAAARAAAGRAAARRGPRRDRQVGAARRGGRARPRRRHDGHARPRVRARERLSVRHRAAALRAAADRRRRRDPRPPAGGLGGARRAAARAPDELGRRRGREPLLSGHARPVLGAVEPRRDGAGADRDRRRALGRPRVAAARALPPAAPRRDGGLDHRRAPPRRARRARRPARPDLDARLQPLACARRRCRATGARRHGRRRPARRRRGVRRRVLADDRGQRLPARGAHRGGARRRAGSRRRRTPRGSARSRPRRCCAPSPCGSCACPTTRPGSRAPSPCSATTPSCATSSR